MKALEVVRAGRLDYQSALELQEQTLRSREEDKIPDTLILVEHPPVLTLGRRGEWSNILVDRAELEKKGVSVFEVSRGGDVTYHGPGQIVGYPVMDLKQRGGDIKGYVWGVEEVFIRLLSREFGIDSKREEKKYTGVWVGQEKITAIGIAVKHMVTMHGFAFNVNTDLAHFRWINPCGITDKGVTSVAKLLGRDMDFEAMNELVVKYFREVFA